MEANRDGLARALAGLIALASLAGMAAQFIYQTGEGQAASQVAWSMARFFTNVGNALVAGVFGLIAWRGRCAVSARVLGMAVCAIVLVGVAFALLLRGLHHPQGLQLLSSHLLHDLVPPAAAAWWLALGRRGLLMAGDPWRWLLLPLTYGLYAEARGAVEGTYPYFFLNPGKVGWGGVLGWQLALGAGFVLTGYLMVRLDRRS
ncbi:MAG: Pr6Pr family membrane protein [Proteobacteria bacterium]|nr:Pr6Pr family membrane protein [Pseudomonadota bacterium]